jgi:transposase-like protein
MDARYEHVRVDGRVESQGVLIAKVVRSVEQCELLAVDAANSESEATIQRHFQGASW